MIEEHILDGDMAIIRPQKDISNGQIAAVTVEGVLTEATLKFFYKKKGRIELHPANKNYTPLAFEGVDQKKVMIIGAFKGIIRNRT